MTFAGIATAIAHLSGKPTTFVLAALSMVAWAACGPLFRFSDTWELVVNTATTIVTFLMVFILQNTQNRDNAALQAKLDSIILALPEADNRLLRIEAKEDEEIERLRTISTERTGP